MPAPLSEGERLARVLRDKRLRRRVLDQEIVALEALVRIYDETEQVETRGDQERGLPL